MKTTLLTIALLAVVATASASSDNDTLTIHKPSRIHIITGDSIQKIKVYGREGDPNYTYESLLQLVDSNYVSETHINRDFGFGPLRPTGKYPNETKSLSMRLALGLCATAGAQGDVSVTTGSSWEIFWTIAEWAHYRASRHDGYSAGFGIGWRNYRMTGFGHFEKGDDGIVSIQHYPTGYEQDFSRIKVFSLQIPLMWNHRFNKLFSFQLGPVINFNTYASIKNRYRDADGRNHKEVVKHIHQQPVTVDIMGSLNTPGGFSIYLKYSPMNLLQSSYADNCNFRTLSFGIYL